MTKPILLAACGLIALASCSPKSGPLLADAAPNAPTTETAAKPAAQPDAAPPEGLLELPAGAYVLDPAHASLIFRVDHLGFSTYTAHFTKFQATLQLDPKNPAAATLSATIDPASLLLSAPPPGFAEDLQSNKFLDSKTFPKMSFKSTKVETIGAREAHVTGDFTLHGVTKPVVLDITYNGGWAGIPQDPHARIGFSAHGKLNRSDFGVGYGVPAAGSKMGVGDEVEVIIEAEFTGPALKQAAPATPAAPAKPAQ